MRPFLKYIVDQIDLDGDLTRLKDYCFVFPTIRAGVYFRKYLTERLQGKFFWSPHIFSIVQFSEFLTDKVTLDSVTLVFELYKSYRKFEPEVRFDEFYHWGQMVVRDFDEVDKYLVPADKLFQNLKDLKEIEELFPVAEEDMAFLKKFWGVLAKEGEDTDLQDEFIRIWEILGKVYEDFRAYLARTGATYEGMAQREIVEKLEAKTLDLPFTKIVFGGFNALSNAEKRMIELMERQGDLTVYWDTDHYYMSSPKQEAGKFVRQYTKQWLQSKSHNWHSQTDLVKHPKNIHVVGVPLKVGQAKHLGQVLNNLLEKEQLAIEETAIILGDESMLFPVLYALPEAIQNINITMGYPLKNTPLFQLMESMVFLQKTRQDVDKKEPDLPIILEDGTTKAVPNTLFYNKFIYEILNNPFIKFFDSEGVRKYMRYLEEYNMIYAYDTTIQERFTHPIYKRIFQKTDTYEELLHCFNEVLNIIYYELKKQEEENSDQEKEDDIFDEHEERQLSIEREFIFQILRQMKRLEEILREYRQLINMDTFWKILKEILQSVKLPFTGEPLRGIQVMGFLETRTLDFKNIFVLGLNEGAIPSTKAHQTFIPFNLRRGFRMPTFLDQDAIYAYHFYHLLQRSENIYLCYNTEVGNFGGGEKSRYLLQLEEELALYDNIQYSSELVSAPLPTQNPVLNKVIIQKNKEVMKRLHRYVTNPPDYEPPIIELDSEEEVEERVTKKLSPSALSLYITCPVQFYLRYVAQLYELDSLDEEISPKIFGNVLHRTIELLYKPHQDKILTDKLIEGIRQNQKKIERALLKAFREEKFPHHKEGKNLLLKKVILRLIDKILENDRDDAPIRIIGLEATEYEKEIELPDGRFVLVSGTIDRIDAVQVDGQEVVRILDYKTGKVKLNDTKTALKLPIDKYLHKYFDDADYKTGFQAYLYSYLYWNSHPDATIISGLYALKEINKGIRYLRKKEPLSQAFFQEFDIQLTAMLSELYDERHPFIQCEDTSKRYFFSPFKGLVKMD